MNFIINFGMFHQQLIPFLEVFDSKNFLYVDGVRIVSDPNSDFAELEKFFNLDHQLEFEMDEEKGCPCLKKPLKFCLGERGITRGSKNFYFRFNFLSIWHLSFTNLSILSKIWIFSIVTAKKLVTQLLLDLRLEKTKSFSIIWFGWALLFISISVLLDFKFLQ